jgi:hypothetical protein
MGKPGWIHPVVFPESRIQFNRIPCKEPVRKMNLCAALLS